MSFTSIYQSNELICCKFALNTLVANELSKNELESIRDLQALANEVIKKGILPTEEVLLHLRTITKLFDGLESEKIRELFFPPITKLPPTNQIFRPELEVCDINT